MNYLGDMGNSVIAGALQAAYANVVYGSSFERALMDGALLTGVELVADTIYNFIVTIVPAIPKNVTLRSMIVSAINVVIYNYAIARLSRAAMLELFVNTMLIDLAATAIGHDIINTTNVIVSDLGAVNDWLSNDD